MRGIEEIFQERMDNDLYNTSYPLNPQDWSGFRVSGDLEFNDISKLSFYIHIPFCEHLCQFCEYSRMIVPDVSAQAKYLDTIGKDISKFIESHPDIELAGFDIGGGTPTALSRENFGRLMDLFQSVVHSTRQSQNFEPSIEGTFQTLDEAKTALIYNAGIKRISLGVQSSVDRVQKLNKRSNPDVQEMKAIIGMLHQEGIEKVNVDMMYGLKGQNIDAIRADIDTIRLLEPEQVTLYELRNNTIKFKENSSKEFLSETYDLWFKSLLQMGYNALYGQNTFSQDPEDKGLSSYLRSRMLECLPYKGFGISAQSMSSDGISYNVGKCNHNFIRILDEPTFCSEYTYKLPPEEYLAKYVAISAYYGRFSIAVADRILGTSFLERYKDVIDFCLGSDYLELNDDFIALTPHGHKYYGAVFSLFYP